MRVATRGPRLPLFILLGAAAVSGCKSEAPPAASAKQAVKARAAADEPTAPEARVIAASAHLRVVDPAAKAVVGRLQLQKAVRQVLVSADARTAYVAASDGVRAVDIASAKVLTKLTENPARHIELSEDGARLTALEHTVAIAEDGTRTPGPFSLVSVDPRTGAARGAQEVGPRTLYARAAPKGGRWIRVSEDGEVRIGAEGEPWSAGAEIDVRAGLERDAAYRVRKSTARHGQVVFLPVEGDVARVLEIDTRTGETRALSLGVKATLRGLAVTPDGRTVLANTGRALYFVDRAGAAPTGEPVTFDAAHVGCAVSKDGKRAFLAQVRDGEGGAVTEVDLEARKIVGKVHLDDITPWAIAVASPEVR